MRWVREEGSGYGGEMSADKFYMIRLEGGPWEPRRKITNLRKAMEIAFKMSTKYKAPATILQSVYSVEIVDGKPVWKDQRPEVDNGKTQEQNNDARE